MKLIQSRDNAFFKQLRKLAESGRERRKAGQTLLDGVHLVESYEKIIAPLDTLVVAESALAGGEIADYLAGREVVVLADALMRELGLVDTPSGLLALAPIPAADGPPGLAADAILLDGVQDPGNVGSILRSAAAAGFRQILLSPDCAQVWSPRVLRAAMGAHFRLELHEDVNLPDFLGAYRGQAILTVLDESATSLYSCDLTGPVAWVFGSEGQGVRPAVMQVVKTRIRIPMPGGGESLNVAAAAAICLFETVRQRP